MKNRFGPCLIVVLLASATVLAAQALKPPPPRLLDAQHYDVRVEIVPNRAFLRAETTVRFTVLQDALNIPFHLNSRLITTGVYEGDTRLATRYDDFNSNRMQVKREDPFLAGTEYTLRFVYEGTLETEQYAFLDTPENSPAFINRNGALLLSQGHWFPSHQFPLDTATIQLRATVPLGFTAVSAGEMQPIETEGLNEVFVWGSRRALGEVPLVISRYLRESFDDREIPLTFFVGEDLATDLTPWVDEIDKILAYYKKIYGEIPVERLSMAQVGRVELSGKGGLGLLLLEEGVLEAKKVPVMELARRLALQWWAYSGQVQQTFDAWLREGFATFAALKYFEATNKDAYPAELAKQAINALKYEDRSPISAGLGLEMGTPEYESIIASKGAWVLNMLSQLVGVETFDSILKEWFGQVLSGPVSTTSFAALVRERTGDDYGWFFLQWVESAGIPEFDVDYKVYKRRDGTFRIAGQLKQSIDLFRMPVEILIETKGRAEEKLLQVNGRRTSFNLTTDTLPLRLKFDPKGKILVNSETMQKRVYVALGDEFLEQNEFISAIAEYTKAKRIDPRSSLVHFRLGETYFKQVSYNLAANSFRDSLNGDLKPEWVETWTHIYLGKIYDVLGQRSRALSEYNKAINSEIDYNGAQEEAKKYLKKPYTKPSHMIN